MIFRRYKGHCATALLMGLAWVCAQAQAGQPETVMVTLRAKPGAEAELARVIEQHWSTARRLNLVRDTPHITVRGTEDGNKTYYVEIFTWRDAGIPDAAPAPIQAIWAEMNRLVETRSGKPGLDFTEVTVLKPAAAAGR